MTPPAAKLQSPLEPAPLVEALVSRSQPVRVFICLVTPYLYGMERAVIELFDALRPEVEPFFLQSSRILQRKPPIIDEMIRRGFSIKVLPDHTDWERLAKPQSLKHLIQMITATVRTNLAVLQGVRGKDVLYVPGISAASGSLLAAIYCRLTRKRVIHHFHDLGTTNRLFPLWIPLVTDFVHNTEFGFREVAGKHPAIEGKHNFVVPYIMEIDDRMTEEPDVCKEFLGWRNVFFVGQISRHKGIDLLIEAFEIVAAKHGDLKLHLIGEGKEEFRAELLRKIASRFGNRIKFWGFREDATRLMRFAYVYVHSSPPSRFHESFGRSVVEAMAHGVPVVCFRSGALQEIVLHERTGLLCDEGAQQLASALDDLIEHPDFREACARTCRQRFENEYAESVIRLRWQAVLQGTACAAEL